jgi:hypothetical protein
MSDFLRCILPTSILYVAGLSADDTTGELPAFGDVSCIAPVGDHDPTSTTARFELEHAVNYQRAHDEELRASSRRLQGRSFGAAPDAKRSLVDHLSTRGFLRNYPTVSLPRMFKLSSKAGSMAGQELRLGNCTATVLCELGRGSYGVVSLLGDGRRLAGDSSASATLAVKAQTETGMLAWEYETLERVRERVGGGSTASTAKTQNDIRFPLAHSMVFLADGAILGLTPALATPSSSVNLIDLVNLYHAHEGLKGIPEVLALHYTAQMLHTIESLHWKGKVLVRPIETSCFRFVVCCCIILMRTFISFLSLTA